MERIQAKISLRFNVYFTAVLIEAKKLQVIVVLLAAWKAISKMEEMISLYYLSAKRLKSLSDSILLHLGFGLIHARI